ncbi:FG-GAP-like repeat-containing protein [Cyanothece sp. BG0011]|uniref:FG-GAP-like repeat-containing protein n=1 Tax=Cyanothece sp. BG0011 TaxID=2082950 RepID=UPI000D1DAF1F|nr:FG-GAP-like repeat-containing protein [Cyanothece sp. BG0011]
MNTKLAIELLTQSHYDLTAFLTGLGLLNDETAVNSLKIAFDVAFQTFLDEYEKLQKNVSVTASQIETVEERLTIADDYYWVEEERLKKLIADKADLVKEIEIFEEQKESIEKFSDQEKLIIQAKADEIKQDIFDTEEELSQLRQDSNSNAQQIYALQKELNAHILRYSLQQELLSLSGLDTAQKLESVKLQIQQQTEDLERLNNQEIVEQETIVNNANEKLSTLQTELEELQNTETLAETALTELETTYHYLLTEDVTGFLDWTIDETTPEVVKLWQKILAVEGEEIVSDRLTSLQSQAASEDAVTVALETDSIEGYVILGAELAEEIEGLSAIWLENLKESHQLTVDVWNLSKQRTEAVNELETYIEDNLADPEGVYLLDKIQLQEAIARQEAQVNYADALGESVDSLEEAIAVLTTQQQQVNLLTEKIEHISTLTSFENQYTTLQAILTKLNSEKESDYKWSHQEVIKVTEELIRILSNNEAYKEIVEQLNKTLNNYQSFYETNSQLYSNKYQVYIDIDSQKSIDLDIVSDNKKEVQQKALSKGAKFSNVTGNYYFIGQSVNNWHAARNEGIAAGGHLVVINSWEEQRWLNQNFGYLTYWIGLTDEVAEGHWRWVNGEPITFTSWIPGEPNNKRNEDYAYSYGSGAWNDVDAITDWGGSKRGLIEINYSLFDRQIKEINDQAIANKSRVTDEIDALHDQGIKILINQTAEILRPLLIDKLDNEIINKTQDLVIEIDLSSEQQEQFIETNLQNYIKQKQDSINQLLIDDTAQFNQTSLWKNHGGTLREHQWRLADFNGDGKKDLIVVNQNNDYHVSISNRNGFNPTHLWLNHGGSLNTHQWQFGDFNGDGKTDLIVANENNDYHVSISQGNGFSTHLWQNHVGNLNTHQWRVGDFNGDGKTDLIVANENNDYYVSISQGNGFSTHLWKNHGGTLSEHQWRLADFNGDGKTDLIVANGNNDYHVSISNGNGFNPTHLWLNHGGSLNTHQWKFGDFNGDGKTDLIVANENNDYHVSISQGNGFVTHLWQNHGGSLKDHQWRLADFNGDGKTDLIVVNQNNDYHVSISQGNGFSTHLWQNHGGTLNTHQWNVHDFNGDGKTDLIVVNQNNDYHVSISQGNGFITYLWQNHGGNLKDHQWKLGDFNGDGKTDLIVANENNDYHVSLHNNEIVKNEVISKLQNLRVETAYLTLQAEQNPNKLQDYLEEYQIILNTKEQRLLSWENSNKPNTDATFSIKSFTPGTGYGVENNNYRYEAGDFNGDGKTDLVHFVNDSWRDGNGYIHVWFSKDDGTFDISYFDPSNYGVNNNHYRYEVGDFNGDGKTDLVHFVDDSWRGGNGYIHVWFSKGDGTFDISYFDPSNYGVNNNHYRYEVGDFNGDGKTDLVHFVDDSWRGGNGYIHVWFSKGDGTFDITHFDPDNYGVGVNNYRYETGDFNGDGKTDLIHFDVNNYVHLWHSNGDGTFSIKSFTPGGGYGVGVNNYRYETGDFNGDGKTDLVHFDVNNYVHLWHSNGDGTFSIKSFTPGGGYGVGVNNYRYETGDFNGDGKTDLVHFDVNNYVHLWHSNGDSKATIENDANTALNNLRNQYYPALSDATTLYNLQQQITDELTNSQQQLETLKAQIAQKQANATAALSQADWYEEQAAIHWDLSRKAGPTWTESRSYKKRGLFRSKRKWITITHVDHHWIIWDTYTKQATNLRKYAANLDQEVIDDTQQQNLTDELITQWQEANQAADEAELTLDQFIAELELLEAQRQLLPEQEAQLETFSDLLPTLKEQLAIAELAAEEAKATTTTELAEYDNSSEAYQTALNDVLEQKATLDTNTQNLLQQIANTRAWVEQQTLFLDTELSETIALQLQLQTQLDTIPPTPLTKGGDVSPLDKGGLRGDETKTIQLQQSIDLLNQKQIILTAQQTALTQKITLLEAQKTVVETEHQLLLATIDSPDSDYSNLEDQLLDAQNALAEVQKLAQQAEATSIALTASMEDLQAFLEVQNDQYLTEIQSKQSTLQDLLAATELKENYTLLATEKQLELNTLETQLQTRLIEATEAGSQEAAYLLEVASANNFATAAEIYYTDYRDLMSDTGGGCAGGIARPDDAVKADYYYNEMLKYRALQDQAQEQADQFTLVKEAAEDQIDLIQQQQAIAQTEFNEIQSNINNTQEDIETLQQQLNIAELRIDALEYLRNWTEQTLVQLLQVEQLNLAQATLEQEFATQRQLGIDETITAQFEKEQADIARDRAIATAKLEQLNQLQAEDALQQALNDLRSDLGLQPIEDIIQQAEYKGQLAGLLSELETIQTQPELPENIQTILAETTADIHDALQGKEAATIQENLLNTANALITEANELQTEIAKLDAEEEQLLGILKQSETDLQGATKALYDEIIISQELGEETDDINQEYLEVLYKIGYAEGAVDLSSELAKQSKDILNQIIDGRIQERKARKKAFVNELLGTVTLVLSVAAAVATAGASLAGTGAFLGVSGTTFSTVATTLKTIGASLSAVQSAYNGDIGGAIFNAGMAALGAAELGGFDLPDVGLTETVKELGFESFKGFETFADVQQFSSGIYNGYQAIDNGDGLTGFLSIVNAALPIGLPEYSYLSQAALSINSGVQLAEEDEWLAATANFVNASFLLGSNLSATFGDDFAVSEQLLNIISTTEFAINIVNGIETISDDGSLEGWLLGIQGIANGLTNYNEQQTTIDKLTNFKKQLLLQNILKQPDITNEEIQNLASEYGLENIFIRQEKNGQEQIYITEEFELNENNQGALITRGEIDPNKATILITFGWLNNVSPEWNFLVAELLENKYPNHNVIIGDWSELAQNVNYFIPASDTQLAGQEMAKKLHELKIDFSQLQIIGHSLGAQVAGAIGKYAKDNYTQVNTIIGLDPASPGFERNTLTFIPYSSDEGRLDKTDAENVILVRSDYDGLFPLGYTKPLGDQDIKITREVLDFYLKEDPSSQNPYLADNLSVGADHSVAYEFIMDALNQGFSLDTLDQFLQAKQEEITTETTYTTSNKNYLNSFKTIVNSDDITITYNNPLPSFLESSEYAFGSYQTNTNNIVPLDPIILDLDGNGLDLSELSTSTIFFDIDADGYAENTAWTTDGILTLDLNQDGTINNITEVFSEYFNDGSPTSGLDALATLDSNQNGIISATDTQFNQILVWQDINQDGISQPDELKTLTDHGITSINLNGITTETIQDGNIIKKRSIFNRNDGTSGEISDIAFLVTQTGFKVNQTDTGIEILAEDDTAVSLLIHETETDLTLNLADSNLQVAIGNIGNDTLYTTANDDIFLSGEAGNDTLVGNDGNDWLVGDEGDDRLQGNAGDDLLYIDAEDSFIDGGEGTDIAIVTTADAVTLDLGHTNLEMVIGNDGDDTFTHSGDDTVVMEGENGNDTLTGGSNDDVITGGDGNDMITGGLGGDILTGGNDADIFIYNSFNDSTTANPDRITDFERGDVIHFSNLPIDSFDDLKITIAEGQTTILVNNQDFAINLNNEITLTTEDFIFTIV